MTTRPAPATSPAHIDFALAYQRGQVDGICWEVFPLAAREKIPAIPKRVGGNGVLDATRETRQAQAWWATDPRRNIGGRVPEDLFVLDIDPRHGGMDNLLQLIADHGGEWHRTRKGLTGGGGCHLLFAHPGGRIGQARLPDGVEIKTNAGYIVLPPSIHPDGPAYQWEQPMRPIAPAVPWLVELLRAAEPSPAPPTRRPKGAALWRALSVSGDSIADWYCAAYRWADVLTGWTLIAGDGESDGSAWRHPAATSRTSATVRHGCLFNYSPNAGLPVTEVGDPHGLTKFRTYTELHHNGDGSAAARAARSLRGRAA